MNLETYYSFPNIDETNNVFVYSPDNGNSWLKIKIPEGCYEIDDINNTIQHEMEKRGHHDPINEDYYIETPVNLVYLPITLDTIDSLDVSITDQDDHLLNLRNEKLTIRFHIREAR